MPRRSPPTPLRLHVGPLPPRGKPKLTMPSLPRPVFHGPVPLFTTEGPVPRSRMTHKALPTIAIPDPAIPGAAASPFATAGISALENVSTWSGPNSPTSAESSSTGSTSAGLRPKKSREFIRGPWDHSGAIRVPFDVEAVLPPPMPAAINVRGGDGDGGKGRRLAV